VNPFSNFLSKKKKFSFFLVQANMISFLFGKAFSLSFSKKRERFEHTQGWITKKITMLFLNSALLPFFPKH